MDKFEYQKKIPEFLPGSSKNFYVVERSFIKGFGSATAVTSVDPPDSGVIVRKSFFIVLNFNCY